MTTSLDDADGTRTMKQALAEWGLAGIRALRESVSVLVIVDVLSFSTAVDVAVSRKAVITPFPFGDLEAAKAEAHRLGAELAYPRRAAGQQMSLSPVRLNTIPPGTRLLLPSPNGSRLSLSGGNVPVLTGCLRNAAAVANAAKEIAGSGAIGVIPAGEQWPDGSLRPAIEDLLGAGAILHYLDLPCSSEAAVMRDAFQSAGSNLSRLISGSVSGLALIDSGYEGDVDMACMANVSMSAPLLKDGNYYDY